MIEKQLQIKPGTSSVTLLPRTDDHLWHANVATPTLLCLRIRAATISLVDLQVRLLFEGSYYSGCGFYSNKYGIWGSLRLAPIKSVDALYFSPPLFLYTHS